MFESYPVTTPNPFNKIMQQYLDTGYARPNVLLHNGYDPRPPLVVEYPFCFRTSETE